MPLMVFNSSSLLGQVFPQFLQMQMGGILEFSLLRMLGGQHREECALATLSKMDTSSVFKAYSPVLQA